MKNIYGEIDELTQTEKITYTLKVLCERPSAREQLRLENIYDPKLRTHLGDKLWTNQQLSASKVYKNTDATIEDILENILERKEHWIYFQRKHPPSSQSFHPTTQMKLKKNCNGQLKIMALQKSIDAKYNFWNKEHLVVSPAYGTRCPQARSITSCFKAYGTRCPQARSIISCVRNSKQWHCSSFWINIHYRQIQKKLKSKVVEEHFAFCIHLIRIHCKQKFQTHWTTQTSSGIYQTLKHNTRNSSTSEAPTETSITDTVLALWIVSSN